MSLNSILLIVSAGFSIIALVALGYVYLNNKRIDEKCKRRGY